MFPRDALRKRHSHQKNLSVSTESLTKNSRFKHALQQMSKAVSGRGEKQNNREEQLCPSKHQKLTSCIRVFRGKNPALSFQQSAFS